MIVERERVGSVADDALLLRGLETRLGGREQGGTESRGGGGDED